MIRSKLCFAAAATIRDAETNLMSIFSLVEDMTFVGLPGVIANLSCVALWERDREDPDSVNGTFDLMLDRDPLAHADIRTDFAGTMRNRTVVNIGGIVISRSGTVHVRFTLQGGQIAEYYFQINAPAPVAQVQNQPQANLREGG